MYASEMFVLVYFMIIFLSKEIASVEYRSPILMK